MMVAMNRKRRRYNSRRRRNPWGPVVYNRKRRRRNPWGPVVYNRKRRRRRNPWGPVVYNRKRRRRRNPWGPVVYNRRHRRRNGLLGRARGGLKGLTSKFTSGFNLKLLGVGAAIVAGTFVANIATQKVAPLLGKIPLVGPYLSNMSEPGSYVSELLTTGGLSWLASMFSPITAGYLLISGATDTMSRVANKYVKPIIAKTLPSVAQMAGFGDYLTVGDARRARPLNGMGDYLTVGDARRARPLFGIHGEDAEHSELESLD